MASLYCHCNSPLVHDIRYIQQCELRVTFFIISSDHRGANHWLPPLLRRELSSASVHSHIALWTSRESSKYLWCLVHSSFGTISTSGSECHYACLWCWQQHYPASSTLQQGGLIMGVDVSLHHYLLFHRHQCTVHLFLPKQHTHQAQVEAFLPWAFLIHSSSHHWVCGRSSSSTSSIPFSSSSLHSCLSATVCSDCAPTSVVSGMFSLTTIFRSLDRFMAFLALSTFTSILGVARAAGWSDLPL